MKRFVLALAALVLACGTVAAKTPEPHPALWRVTGKNATVYLFGSVHILSPEMSWRDARIEQAIHLADTFYFEVDLDQAAVKDAMLAKGSLPQGQSLRALLPPDSQKDLDEDLASLDIPEAQLDMRRPWLVSMTMVALKMYKDHQAPPTGVDVQLVAEAKALGKKLRYLETMDQQIALLAPDDPKIELQEFESFLKDFKKESLDEGPMVDAWIRGDEDRLTRLLMKDMDKHPDLRKAMFDDRNAAWTKTLEGVLDNESGTFLVTVGAGHLLTDRGVPALLAKAGYKVERI